MGLLMNSLGFLCAGVILADIVNFHEVNTVWWIICWILVICDSASDK